MRVSSVCTLCMCTYTQKCAGSAGMLVSLSVGNKWPHSEWLGTAGMSSLTVLEADRN